uniref:Calpain small subunit 1 n=1 Tax=Terrapene triunguis TaxID=2587831 RepID=A0A674IJD4_9SAUR
QVAVGESDTTGNLNLRLCVCAGGVLSYPITNFPPSSPQRVYKQYDTDRSGTIGSSELPGAFEAAGFRLNEQLYQMIVRRYSDENGHMDFDNFISCLVRLDAMFRKWPAGRSWG